MAEELLSPQHWEVNHADTYQVAQVTGAASVNRTDVRWNVHGTDLGHMFLYQDRLFMVFGDTFGPPDAVPFFSVPHSDWRSNTMAEVDTATRPTGGLRFLGMITDRPRHAKELLEKGSTDVTVIPTYGVSVDQRMFLYFMAVRQWGAAGRWTLNHSGIAYSDDQGHTWSTTNTTWPAESNFGQVALVTLHNHLYVFGIPAGRYGGVQLARAPTTAVLDKDAYEYWNGSSWIGSDPAAAATIVAAPVGELSVQYNSYYQKWLMMYLIDDRGHIVLRVADSLTGPWGPAQVVVTAAHYPQLYAPYITPLWTDDKDIYFTMSMFAPYQVFLMRTSLTITEHCP